MIRTIPVVSRLAAALAAIVLGSAAAGEAEARAVLVARCGQCHDSAQGRSKPEALAVFDLAEKGWEVRLSDAQLGKIMGRLNGAEVSDQERQVVQKWIDAERERRAAPKKG